MSRTSRALVAVCLCLAPLGARAAESFLDIPYTLLAGDGEALTRRSLDLYLPPNKNPPLFAFVPGGSKADYDDAQRIGRSIARALTERGAAVAVIRYRRAPATRHPHQIEDVAAAVGYLRRSAARYGYDAKRLFLAGQASGAQLAALAALDARYLRAHGLKPADLAGVVVISGLYDLMSNDGAAVMQRSVIDSVYGVDMAARRAASPIAHASKRAPPFLILSAAHDLPGLQIEARRFARAMNAANAAAVDELMVPQTDHLSLAQFSTAQGRVAADIVAAFMNLKKLDPVTVQLLAARRTWNHPSYSTEPFWKSGVPVRAYPMQREIISLLERVFEYNAWELRAFPLKRYHAVDLLAYLDRQPNGRGDFITLTNVRGEKVYWRRADIARYHPVIVVGLDDERNLFRLTVFYQQKLEYSWKPDRPPMMARPVGAFVYFPNGAPASLQPEGGARFALLPDSFRAHDADPFAALADVPDDARDVMVANNGCLTCHSFRGAGARAGHITAARGAKHAGFALALESYPAEAWRRFVFDPNAAAKLIGVRPNPVSPAAAQVFYDVVVAERARLQP